MKIFSAEQIKRIDERTIQRQHLTSLQLMERAATELVNKLIQLVPANAVLGFLIGPGNNGGDAAAMARLLHEKGRKVWTFQPFPNKMSSDLAQNISRYQELGLPLYHHLDELLNEENLFLIDGFFGSGLSRPLEGEWLELFAHFRHLGVPCIAIDVPSGLPCSGEFIFSPEAVLPAVHTLCIDSIKICMLLPDSGPYCGGVHRVEIGLDHKAKEEEESEFHLITAHEAASLLPIRPAFSHKGTFGTSVILGGTSTMPGALTLATGAALRSGCGLVAVGGPDDAREVVMTNFPEATWFPQQGKGELDGASWPTKTSALGIGPGMGTGKGARQSVKQVLHQAHFPVVFDADALNILAENKTWLSFLPKDAVLTPHPGELDRLVGSSSTGMDQLNTARLLAKKSGAVVVLKGRHTATCSPSGTVVFNSSGTTALAKGGSGDVLTGLITGLLAQGLPPFSAAVLGVFVHGLASELAVEHAFPRSVLGRELIASLPVAFNRLERLGIDA